MIGLHAASIQTFPELWWPEYPCPNNHHLNYEHERTQPDVHHTCSRLQTETESAYWCECTTCRSPFTPGHYFLSAEYPQTQNETGRILCAYCYVGQHPRQPR